MSATDGGNFADGTWQTTWGHPFTNTLRYSWGAASFGDECRSPDNVAANANSSPRQRNVLANLGRRQPILPLEVFPILARTQSLITATERTRLTKLQELTENGGIYRYSSGLTIAYRPIDINQPIVIEAGVFLHPLLDGDGQPPELGRSSIEVSYGLANESQLSRSTLAIEEWDQAEWRPNATSSLPQPAPIYHSGPDCSAQPRLTSPSLRLFVTLRADGVDVSPIDPLLE